MYKLAVCSSVCWIVFLLPIYMVLYIYTTTLCIIYIIYKYGMTFYVVHAFLYRIAFITRKFTSVRWRWWCLSVNLSTGSRLVLWLFILTAATFYFLFFSVILIYFIFFSWLCIVWFSSDRCVRRFFSLLYTFH